jgi:hypothetical protein
MSSIRALLSRGIELVHRFVRLAVSRGVPLAKEVDAWALPRARALIRTLLAYSTRAVRWTAITLARATAIVISSLDRHLPKLIHAIAAFMKEATTLILAAVRAVVEFAKVHHPRSPAVDTRAGRFWWHGVEAVEGATAALRRRQKRFGGAVSALSQSPSNVGRRSTAALNSDTDDPAVAAGEQHPAASGPVIDQSVMSSGASPRESNSSRISSR